MFKISSSWTPIPECHRRPTDGVKYLRKYRLLTLLDVCGEQTSALHGKKQCTDTVRARDRSDREKHCTSFRLSTRMSLYHHRALELASFPLYTACCRDLICPSADIFTSDSSCRFFKLQTARVHALFLLVAARYVFFLSG